MIISSKHHDLLEQFQSANDAEGAAITALNSYMSIPDHEWSVVTELMEKMQEAHEYKMTLWSKLQEVRLDKEDNV